MQEVNLGPWGSQHTSDESYRRITSHLTGVNGSLFHDGQIIGAESVGKGASVGVRVGQLCGRLGEGTGRQTADGLCDNSRKQGKPDPAPPHENHHMGLLTIRGGGPRLREKGPRQRKGHPAPQGEEPRDEGLDLMAGGFSIQTTFCLLSHSGSPSMFGRPHSVARLT